MVIILSEGHRLVGFEISGRRCGHQGLAQFEHALGRRTDLAPSFDLPVEAIAVRILSASASWTNSAHALPDCVLELDLLHFHRQSAAHNCVKFSAELLATDLPAALRLFASHT